ncbi:MAG: LysE family transporter [Alphaproteobacteria bacterium]
MEHILNAFLIKGFLVGFFVAAPPGPVAIFCIRQTMAYGLISGLAAGLGTTLADAFYSWVAAMGSNAINSWMKSYDIYFYIVGGLFLVYLGAKIFTSPLLDKSKPPKEKKAIHSFVSTLFLTIASPMTTFLFLGMFVTFGVFETALSGNQIGNLVIGVSAGSMIWWTVLAFFVHFVHTRFDIVIFRYINRIAGTGILGFGTYTVGKALYKLIG